MGNQQYLRCALFSLLLLSGVSLWGSSCACAEKTELTALLKGTEQIPNFVQQRLEIAKISKSYQDLPCQVLARYFVAMTYARESKFDSAGMAFASQKYLLDQLDCDRVEYVAYHLGCASYLGMKMMPDSAMYHATQALDIARESGGRKEYLFANNVLAAIHGGQGDYDLALPYAREVLRSLDAVEMPKECIIFLFTARSHYLEAYNLDTTRHALLDTALMVSRAALAMAKENSMVFHYTWAYHNLAEGELAAGHPLKALAALDSAEAYLPPLDPRQFRVQIIEFRAQCYQALGDYDKATTLLQSAFPLVNPGNANQLHELWSSLYRAARLAGNHQVALEALEHEKHLTDSLYKLEKIAVAREYEAKFHKKEQDEAIAGLQQDQELKDLRIRSLYFVVLVVVLVAVLLLTGLFFLHRLRLARSRRTLQEAELRLNRARINPHVFFNVLTSLQAMALEPARAELVPDYLARYARLMRMMLESTYTELIPLEQELRNLEDYLAIQSMHYPGRFTHVVVIEPGVDPEEVQVPSLLLQPLCENAIEHGFKGRTSGGELRIEVRKVDTGYLAVVDDNGEPETDATSNHAGFPSRASQIIEDRLLLLNARLRRGLEFVLRKGAKPQGYRVEILIPEFAAGSGGANLS